MRDILIDYSKYGIVFKEEDVGKGITMESAYNEEGNYIGDRDTARNLVKMGIKPYAIKKGGVCCIGFNEEEQKWYGWSHRAIYGFGIGSVSRKVTPGTKYSEISKPGTWTMQN
ncbi:hypothetical protein [uncultured Methanolobus sp.]|uniref:hypothetical protein n=1 Tax=uncultured Methanolobus sp. TaxID=218300 RepID=UPI002AAB9D39|nr:hypothetical protein [uncultured Methanolobus sp.]